MYLYATSLENVLVQGYTPKNSSLIVQNMQNVTITSMFSFHYLASLTIAIYFGQRKKKILNNGDGFFLFLIYIPAPYGSFTTDQNGTRKTTFALFNIYHEDFTEIGSFDG